MIHLKKVLHDGEWLHSCGTCLECGAPVILKGKKVCDIDQLLAGGGIKQHFGECFECRTRFIINNEGE